MLDSLLFIENINNGHINQWLQYHEGVRAMWLAEKGGDLYHHPYDLGVYENLVSVSRLRTIICAAFFCFSLNV
jgi:hypothetical protein